MHVLVTGNQGYIGSVLSRILIDKGYEVTGFDIGYFANCYFGASDQLERQNTQICKDIRKVDEEDLVDVDAIIHLAALSNDYLGELSPGLTEQINLGGTSRLAKLAKKCGVKRFIYSSSQSMYGVSEVAEELAEDNSKKNPVTAYAKTKWDAECFLKKLNGDDFTVVCFRPSTVFGISPRLRCDVVFNNLVACAYTTGKIEIKSDGTPWRPVVHVEDVCAAYIAGLQAPDDLVGGRSYNVGIHDGNYSVKDLAEAAQKAVPGSELTFTGEHGGDSRTYRVSFDRILSELRDYYRPTWNLKRGGEELVTAFQEWGFTERDFRGAATNRLQKINSLLSTRQLNSDLEWL